MYLRTTIILFFCAQGFSASQSQPVHELTACEALANPAGLDGEQLRFRATFSSLYHGAFIEPPSKCGSGVQSRAVKALTSESLHRKLLGMGLDRTNVATGVVVGHFAVGGTRFLIEDMSEISIVPRKEAGQ